MDVICSQKATTWINADLVSVVSYEYDAAKFESNIKHKIVTFIQQNAFQNVGYKMASISFRL